MPITVLQDFTIETRGEQYWLNLYDANLSQIRQANENSFVKIERFLSSDLFNIKISKAIESNSMYIDDVAIWNVANKYINYDYAQNPTKHQPETTRKNYYVVHHSMFNDVTFENASIIAGGIATGQVSGNHFNPLYTRTLFLTEKPYQKKIETDYNHFIELKSIKEISMVKNHDTLTHASINNHSAVTENRFATEVLYNHLYIVPVEPKRLMPNATVADIYIRNDENLDFTHDFLIENGTMKVSNMKENIDIHFETESTPVTNTPVPGATYIGSINVDESMFYNYAEQKVEIGFNPYSQTGDLIPYDFVGNYTRTFKIKFNEALNDIVFSFSKFYDTPVLDPFEGDVVLNYVSNQDSSNGDWLFINHENQLLIIDQEENEENITYNGIKRLSHDKES